MTAFEANFGKILIRFYLMMAVILIAGFTGYWAAALLGLPIFLSAILGFGKKQQQAKKAKIQSVKAYAKAA